MVYEASSKQNEYKRTRQHVYNPKRYGHFQHMAFCIFHITSNPRVRNRMTSLKCILIQYKVQPHMLLREEFFIVPLAKFF